MKSKEHIETLQTRAIKPGGNRKKSIVIFIVLPAVLTILFPIGGLPYLCGRFIPYAEAFGNICLFYPLTCVFIIYCLCRGVSRRFRSSREGNAKSQLTSAAEIGIPLVFMVSLLVPVFTSFKGIIAVNKPFMYGLRTRMKSKADVEAIRDWLESIDDEDYDDSYSEILRSKWAESLKTLKPIFVFLSVDENDNAKVRLMWRYGHIVGGWGVEIGAENMEIPPSDFSMYGEYRLPVEPGVYVWRGLE